MHIVAHGHNVSDQLNMPKHLGEECLKLCISSKLTKLKMSDKWFDMHKELSGFTWCDGNDKPKSRTDYVFLSNNFVYEMDKIIIRRIPGTHSNGSRLSDHRALRFSFKLCNNKIGSGYWKLNTSFLQNEDYIKGIKDIISNVKNDADKSSLEKWEVLKNMTSNSFLYTLLRNITQISGIE